MPATNLGERAGAADDAGIGQCIAAVDDECGVVDDVAGHAARGAAITDLQRAGADRRVACVGVVARQRQHIVGTLGERAVAAHNAAKGQIVTTVEVERTVVDDIALDRSGGAAVADLQRPGADRGAARIGAVARQRQRCWSGSW